MDFRLELVTIPVSDVEQAKRFSEKLGWRLDIDFTAPGGFRVIQVAPPGSACSITLGNGITTAARGSVQGPDGNAWLLQDVTQRAPGR